jgi:hypothetical protein
MRRTWDCSSLRLRPAFATGILLRGARALGAAGAIPGKLMRLPPLEGRPRNVARRRATPCVSPLAICYICYKITAIRTERSAGSMPGVASHASTSSVPPVEIPPSTCGCVDKGFVTVRLHVGSLYVTGRAWENTGETVANFRSKTWNSNHMGGTGRASSKAPSRIPAAQ